MPFHKRNIRLLFLLFFFNSSTGLLAQSVNNNLPDTVASVPVIDEQNKEEHINEDETASDEFELYYNQLSLTEDSVRKFKNDKKLFEAKMLDSLLRDNEKYQQLNNAANANKISIIESILLSPVTKIFFWILAGSFIVFIIYKLFISEGFFQLQSSKNKLAIVKEAKAENEAAADYPSLIIQSETQQNLRLASRYQYLHLLQKLAAASLIEYSPDKTNAAYQRELNGNKHRSEFAALTLHYEYIWYGEFEIDATAYHLLASRFKQLKTQL